MSSQKWFENDSDLSVPQIVELESEFRIDSLVCAIESIIIQKDDSGDDINEAELVVLAVEAMEREVNNGGFAQFFSNDSWRFTPYLVSCLNVIGAQQAEQIAEEAINKLGVGELSDPQKYFEDIKKAAEDENITEKLHESDSKYFAMKEDIAGLLFEYIKKNINEFKV